MDDLTAVWDAGTPPLTDEARAAARTRLQRAIVQERRRTVAGGMPRRLALRGALAGTAAAMTAGAVIATMREGKDTDAPRITPLSAAQVLHKAADRSRADGSRLPVPRDNQYFYTKTYIERTYVKGGRTRTWTDESWMSVDGTKPSWRQEHGKVHHDPPLTKHEVRWPPTVYSKLATMPTDPDKLLDAFRLGGKSSPQADSMAFWEACLFMQGPRVMPPGLQAAAFEALAKIPGVRPDYDEVDVLGRHAVGVSYPKVDFTFLFDRRTFDYLGMRLRGSSSEYVHGHLRRFGWYRETRSLRQVGVVDRIGQHP